jgi:nucleotide-binding universal stress UspA family protein
MKLVRILLPIDQHGTTNACVATAFMLAKRFHIEVQALHCPQQPILPTGLSPISSPVDPLATVPLLAVEDIELARRQASLQRAHAKAWWQKTTKNFPSVASKFASAEGLVSIVTASYARLSDLTIVPSVGESDDSFWSEVRNGALLSSGRPMLVVPHDSKPVRENTIVVAWKDRPETIRAIVAAGSLLAKAKSVRIVSVTESDEDKSSLIEMLRYLKRAGVAAKAKTIPESSAIGELLVKESARAKMLVMGGSGRSHLAEWIFGGATNYVLRNAAVPTLMTH